MNIHHLLPPFRIDVAIALLLAIAALAGLALLRFRRSSRPRQMRIDIVHPPETEAGDRG